MKRPYTLCLATAALLFTLNGASFAHDATGDGNMQPSGQACISHPRGVSSQFTEAQRDLLRDTMSQTHAENEPLKERLHALRKDMHAIMQSSAFDQHAFLDKSARAQQLMAEMKQNKVKAFVAVAPQFAPDERKFVWKMMMHHHHHHWHHDMRGNYGGSMSPDGGWAGNPNGGAPPDQMPSQ